MFKSSSPVSVGVNKGAADVSKITRVKEAILDRWYDLCDWISSLYPSEVVLPPPVECPMDCCVDDEDLWSLAIDTWAGERGIYGNGTPEGQMLKLTEELGELSSAIQKDDKDAIADAIGDMTVVLTILARMKDLQFEDCCWDVWSEISGRTGKMVDGVFVKDDEQ